MILRSHQVNIPPDVTSPDEDTELPPLSSCRWPVVVAVDKNRTETLNRFEASLTYKEKNHVNVGPCVAIERKCAAAHSRSPAT